MMLVIQQWENAIVPAEKLMEKKVKTSPNLHVNGDDPGDLNSRPFPFVNLFFLLYLIIYSRIWINYF